VVPGELALLARAGSDAREANGNARKHSRLTVATRRLVGGRMTQRAPLSDSADTDERSLRVAPTGVPGGPRGSQVVTGLERVIGRVSPSATSRPPPRAVLVLVGTDRSIVRL
jgi:hypothetical protein